MIRMFAISSVVFGLVFLTGCYQAEVTIENATDISAGGVIETIVDLPSGEYKIQKDIVIEESGTLRIAPGATLLFAQDAGIFCKGDLEAKGTEENKITFSAIDTKLGWNNITFFEPESRFSEMEYCVISYGNGISTIHPEFNKPEHSASEQCGGGIYCYYSSPTIKNCEISNNNIKSVNGAKGGGICIDGSPTPTIINCVISNNTCYGGGGGIYAHSKSVCLQGCKITENTCYDNEGGGISASYDNILLIDCLIANNKIISTKKPDINHCNGGGASLSGNTTIINCKFLNNSNASGLGGGIYAKRNIEVRDSVIEGNVAQFGGGIFGIDGVLLNVDKTEIINNQATGQGNAGGGIWINTKGAIISLMDNNGIAIELDYRSAKPRKLTLSEYNAQKTKIEENTPNQVTEY